MREMWYHILMIKKQRFLCALATFLSTLLSLPRAYATCLVPLPGGGGGCTDPAAYFNALFPWVEGVCAGIVLIWVLWAGTGIILAGADTAKVEAAKKQMFGAIAGLVILLLAAAILHLINPAGFDIKAQ